MRRAGSPTLAIGLNINPYEYRCRVFVISSTAEMIHPTDAIQAGADGVIDKLDSPEQVFAAIRGEGGS